MATRYRRDLTYRDFEVSKAVKRGIIELKKDVEGAGFASPLPIEVWDLKADDTQKITPIPKVSSWYLSAGGEWKLNNLQYISQDYYMIDKRDMRRVCGFVHIKEAEVLHVLYRMSILAVHGSFAKPLTRFLIGDKEMYLLEMKRLAPEGHIGHLKYN